jgi:glycosyltransferase involved in cell wall biosynthesis
LLHGVSSRAANILAQILDRPVLEALMHRWFSRWAARVLNQELFDVVHGFSGVCEELFTAALGKSVLHTLVRGSAHIEEQFEILSAEERRVGYKVDKPSRWMRQRELREYSLADCVIVLSHYAHNSFINQGIPASKLGVLPLGAQLDLFRPARQIVAERCERIRRGAPLRVLTVGSFSFQKGAWDYVAVAKELHNVCSFRFVGTVVQQIKSFARSSAGTIEFVPRTSQHTLPEQYRWGDIFLFLTIHDGYAVVLAQAAAAALPILSTTNCAAPDLVTEEETGWVFPIRCPDLFIERLRWCDQHREELATMVEKTYNLYAPRDWADVAQGFVDLHANLQSNR